jgi:hypothetical protein
MAALLHFDSARDQRQLAALLSRPPRIAASWIMDPQGRLICLWREARASRGPAKDAPPADSAVEASRRKAA